MNYKNRTRVKFCLIKFTAYLNNRVHYKGNDQRGYKNRRRRRKRLGLVVTKAARWKLNRISV